jgi:proteasome lid subunit RPN8/RPN11
MHITKKTIEQMYQHALREYPDECCGIVTGNEQDQTVHACRNIQNQLHAEDPQQYPRDARTAYVIDRSEFDSVVSAAENRGEEIIALYHSHADHEAYFSATDVEAQIVFDEPEFPDALHIVISVMNRKIHGIKGFLWKKDTKDFGTLEARDFTKQR